jgi:hypothetical protein
VYVTRHVTLRGRQYFQEKRQSEGKEKRVRKGGKYKKKSKAGLHAWLWRIDAAGRHTESKVPTPMPTPTPTPPD